MPFNFHSTPIPDVTLIEPRVFGDARGFFLETFKRSEFEAAGIDIDFVQVNQSHSEKGVLRGLHFQKAPYAQGKLVRCFTGSIWDVVVDIRTDSPTFKQWYGVELNDQNHHLLWVPPGLAHGFCVLSDEADICYYVTGSEYNPATEDGIRWDDPEIGIAWPITSPTLSGRDSQLPMLNVTAITS